MGEEVRKTCRLCGGTGKQIAMNSWFIADGFRRLRCGICGGSGNSSYMPPSDYVREQAKFRERFQP